MRMQKVPERWDLEADLVAVGSSSGGLVAAIVGHDLGMKSVVLEKSGSLGGGNALSGGIIWIPNNAKMRQRGLEDSREEALTYIRKISMGRHDEEKAAAFVDQGPEMVDYMEAHTPLRMIAPRGYPDYRAELPGGKSGGRYLLPDPLNMAIELAEAEARYPFLSHVRRPPVPMQLGVPEGIWAGGRTLIGPLVLACLERGIEISLDTRGVRLILDGRRVVGLAAEKEGRPYSVMAKKGVLLATGGFEWNQEMSSRFIHGPRAHPFTNPQNEGDGHIMGMEVGGAVAMMEHTIWLPTIRVPGEEIDGRPLYRLFLASCGKPGDIIVNRAGKRCCNESYYPEMGTAFTAYDPSRWEQVHLPMYWIADQSHRDKYPCGPLEAGQEADRADWLSKSNSLRGLAEKLGLPPEGLEETVRRFNSFAKEGRDPDLHRGESAYDRWAGDPNHGPNPCLAPLERPPFYGVQIHPGTAGHRGGLVTNGAGQVLSVRGEPIPGLYATGNTSAHLAMGVGYNSGFANGQSMVFGYAAARHMAKGGS